MTSWYGYDMVYYPSELDPLLELNKIADKDQVIR
jgi:hypothetical protein